MRLSDVMTRGVECVKPSDSVAHAAERMRDLDVGSLPVCGEDNLLAGMVTDRDITIRGTASCCDAEKTTVADVMTPQLAYCFEDDYVADAVKLMEEKQIRRLPVLSREKRLVGIVSLGDLAVKGDEPEKNAEALREISEPAVPSR